MSQYGWTRHNGRDFGQHEVLDPSLQLKLTSSFLKEQSEHEVKISMLEGTGEDMH